MSCSGSFLKMIASCALACSAYSLHAHPSKANVLSLSTAIDMSMRKSANVVNAEVDLKVSKSRRRGTFGELGPNIVATYSDVIFDKPVAVALGPVNYVLRPHALEEGNVTITQPITGLITAVERVSLERKRRDESQVNLSLTRTETAFEVAAAYRKAQQANEMVYVAEDAVKASKSQGKDAQALLDSGRILRSDLLKITIAQQEARSDLAKAIATRKKAYDQLRYITGISSEQDFSLEDLANISRVLNFVPPTLESALSKASAERLELKKANLEMQKAESITRLARWKFMPEVNFFISWDRFYSALPFGTPSFTRSYGLAARWEIWDRGSRLTATKEASGMLQKSNTTLQDTKDKMRLEIQGILADFEAMKEALAAEQVIVSQAEEAYRLDKVRFANGLLTATDLLLSQANRTKAQGSLIESITDMSLLILNLDKALGNSMPQV